MKPHRMLPSFAKSPRPGTLQGGFALVIVLWVLAGLTVIAVVVASSARVSNESVKLLRDRVRAEAEFISTSSRIKVIAATGIPGRMSIVGAKGSLLTDGRGTSVNAGESVALQDTRGLINFNRNKREQLGLLLSHCGANDSQTEELLDALSDYVDQDNVKHLNGAEAFDYRVAGLREPRNAPLLSREEVWRVKGWAALRDQWNALGCDEFVTVHNDGRFNSNTASGVMLQTAGMTEDAASALVTSRREGVELVTGQLTSGIQTDSFSGIGGGFVGTILRVTHRLSTVDWILVYDLELTPAREGGPWRTHEIRYRPRPQATVENLADLPASDFELSDSERDTPNALSNSPFAN